MVKLNKFFYIAKKEKRILDRRVKSFMRPNMTAMKAVKEALAEPVQTYRKGKVYFHFESLKLLFCPK